MNEDKNISENVLSEKNNVENQSCIEKNSGEPPSSKHAPQTITPAPP